MNTISDCAAKFNARFGQVGFAQVIGQWAADFCSQRRYYSSGRLLTEMLRHGPQPGADLKALAKADGIAERTLLRAKSRLGLISYRAGIGASGQWMWQWPTDRPLPPERAAASATPNA